MLRDRHHLVSLSSVKITLNSALCALKISICWCFFNEQLRSDDQIIAQREALLRAEIKLSGLSCEEQASYNFVEFAHSRWKAIA